MLPDRWGCSLSSKAQKGTSALLVKRGNCSFHDKAVVTHRYGCNLTVVTNGKDNKMVSVSCEFHVTKPLLCVTGICPMSIVGLLQRCLCVYVNMGVCVCVCVCVHVCV